LRNGWWAAAAGGTINLHQPAGRLKLGTIQNKIKIKTSEYIGRLNNAHLK
jgi:hypothetical protein